MTVLLAVLLAAPLAYAGQVVAAVIFGIAPVAWLGWVTLSVYRMEKRTRSMLLSPQAIEPVVVVADDGVAEVHLRMRAALEGMEAVDIDNGEYQVYLADGEICELWVAAGEQIMATPTGRFDRPAAMTGLRKAGLLRVEDGDLEGAVWRVAREGKAAD